MDWDLSAYFSTFDHPTRQAFESELSHDLGSALETAKSLPALQLDADAWEALVLQYEALGIRLSHISSYVHALAAAEANNADYRDAEARLSALTAGYAKLQAQVVRGLAGASEQRFDQWLQRPALAEAGYALERLRRRARTSMGPELEELAADLSTDGIEAWSRLYDAVMSDLSFELVLEGESEKRLPFSARRSLMEGTDRRTRKAAFEGGNRALQPWVPTLAKALNHIAGTRLTLSRRRGARDVLDESVFDAGITRSTLDAMFEAVERQIDVPRQIMALKAQAEGVEQLGWYDIGAIMPFTPTPSVSWGEAVSKVKTAFQRKYPSLAAFFDRAIEQSWVDHTPRDGKRAGAFCTTSKLIGQSRVFMTFGGTLGDVSTLAHEMGHAFHSALLRESRPLASKYPMTLAESASIFAELVLINGLLDDGELSSEQQSALLAAVLNDAPVFLLDVNTRYQFERAFYQERAQGEVRPERLCQLMSETQQRVFGPVLDPAATDPYYWASKLHFFITGVSFYNYPYIFGYLLSRGLYARFEQEGPSFLPRYEQFLSRSGREEPATLARSVLGCDLEQPEFWEQSIRSLQAPLDTLQQRRVNASGSQ